MMVDFDIIVVGGGHAGIEACSAASRMGLNVVLITMDRSKIGLMSCNPAIGGIAKGQLVREIDALGGEMAKIIDRAGIHFKMLNKSRGPAVWSPRAQADRKLYAQVAQERLKRLKNFYIIESVVNDLSVRDNKIQGVKLISGEKIYGKSIILTTGTFLNGLIHIGLNSFAAGRSGERPSKGITDALRTVGLESGRLKTGTPPRIHKESIDFSKLLIQYPDVPPAPFSYFNEKIDRKQLPCYIAYTNKETHAILRDGFDQSPMFTGKIQAKGPRYCPSIEDKIKRFSEKERHQLFLEPEGYDDPAVYLNGFSTSLPEHIQRKAINSINGLEKAEIIRLGYAVEYDFFPPHQLKYTLESKRVLNLYFAGQINGTSGYEEAAAQGLMAGINAASKILGLQPLRLERSEAYIGVLIDDLINKSTSEPYRMFTSMAEFRLSLRQDNADLRLGNYGIKYGLLDHEEMTCLERKRNDLESLKVFIKDKKMSIEEFNTCFGKNNQSIKKPDKIEALIKRPEINLKGILDFLKIKYRDDAIQEIEFNAKYEGYIRRNQKLINKFNKFEDYLIPDSFNYTLLESLSKEAKEKLTKIKPESFGQASRISGVSPADLSILLIYLEREKYMGDVPRETGI